MARRKTKKTTEFRFYAPGAKAVNLAGDFNQWDTQSLAAKKSRKGLWRVKVALDSGKYQYKFFVDGQWQNDPNCTVCVPNAFGTSNCTIDLK